MNIDHYLSLNYHSTVSRDEDGDYIVEVQELPGCVADGKTPNEAFGNLRSAMTSWITSRLEAGLEVPAPKTDHEFSGRILLRLPKFLHARLAAQSESEGVSLNQYLVSLLSDASARFQAPATKSMYSLQEARKQCVTFANFVGTAGNYYCVISPRSTGGIRTYLGAGLPWRNALDAYVNSEEDAPIAPTPLLLASSLSSNKV